MSRLVPASWEEHIEFLVNCSQLGVQGLVDYDHRSLLSLRLGVRGLPIFVRRPIISGVARAVDRKANETMANLFWPGMGVVLDSVGVQTHVLTQVQQWLSYLIVGGF